MVVDTQKVIDWYNKSVGKIVYSMGTGSELDQGPRQILDPGQQGNTDCSGGMASALYYGGAKPSQKSGEYPAYSTVSLGKFLESNGYEVIYKGANKGKTKMWDPHKGDIIIMGIGSIEASAGGAGHVGVLSDKNTFVSVQYNGGAERNAVTKAPIPQYWVDHGRMTYFAVYRNTNKKSSSSSSSSSESDKGKVRNSDEKSTTKAKEISGRMWRYNDWIFGADASGSQKSSNKGTAADQKANQGKSSGSSSKTTGKVGQLKGKLAAAVQEALNPKNWNSHTDSFAPGIDVDGAYHAQCFDLTRFILNKAGIDSSFVAGRSNNQIKQGWATFEKLGWKCIKNPSFKQLGIGGITYEAYSFDDEDHPHTEMITAIEGNKISFVTQNLPSPSIHTVTYSGSGAPIGFSGNPIVAIAIPPSKLIK